MITTFPTTVDLASAAAEAIRAHIAEGLNLRGQASLIATGGRSPGPTYDRLANMSLGWSRVSVTLSDERCVPASAPESNARLVRERLLQGPAAAARFIPLWPAQKVSELAALQPFDAVMLGMGEDGHIASLIPGDPGLGEALTTSDLVRTVPAGLGRPPLARITLTLAALLNARAIFLLIAGETKRGVIERAMAGQDLPVGHLLARAASPIRIFWTPEA